MRKVLESIDAERLLRLIDHRTEKIQREGDSLRALCPIHDEQVMRTLIVDAAARTFNCQRKKCAGFGGGDLIDLYARARKLTRPEAAEALAEAFAVQFDDDAREIDRRRAMEEAANLIAIRAWEPAEALYRRVLDSEPRSIEALRGLLDIHTQMARHDDIHATTLTLGRALSAVGEHDQAHLLLREFLERWPKDADVKLLQIECLENLDEKDWAAEERLALAEKLLESGDAERAMQVLSGLPGPKFGSEDLDSRVAAALARAGRAGEAVELWTRRADACADADDDAGAWRALRAAIELAPERADLRLKAAEIAAGATIALEALGACCDDIESLIRDSERGPASRALEILLEAYPQHPRLIELKGDLESARGHDEAALEMRLKGVDLFENSRDFEGALSALEKVINDRQESVLLLTRRAKLLVETGETDKAIEAYLKIAEVFEEGDDLDQAAATLQTVIDLAPDEMAHRERQLDLYVRLGVEAIVLRHASALAEAMRLRGDREGSARILERSLTVAPHDCELLAMHAEALRDLDREGEAAEQFLSAARAHLDEGQQDRARRCIDAAIKCLPEHMEARELRADLMIAQGMAPQGIHELLALGEAYARGGDFAGVVKVAEKVLNLSPDNLAALQELAEAYGRLGRRNEQREVQLRVVRGARQSHAFTRATEICQAILREDEHYTPALEELISIAESTRQTEKLGRLIWQLAQAHARAGRRDEEMKALDRVLSMDACHRGAWFRRLELMMQWSAPKDLAGAVDKAIETFASAEKIGEIEQILEDLRAGRAVKPEIVAGLAELKHRAGDQDGLKMELRRQADLLKRALRDDEAIEVMGRLAEMSGADPAIGRQRIELLLRTGRRDEAADEHLRLAERCFAEGRLPDAEQMYHEALKIRSGDLIAREGLLEVHLKTGDRERADEAIEDLAAHYMKRGEIDRALATYERVFSYSPKSEETLRKIIAVRENAGQIDEAVKAYHRLLDVHLAAGRGGPFEQTAERAIALDPGNRELRRRLIDRLTDVGRTSEAEMALIGLVETLITANDLDEAARAIDEVLSMNQESVQGRAYRAEIMARRGNADAALREFRSLTGKLGHVRSAGAGEGSPAFALGNYEGLTRVREYTFDNFVVGARNNFAHATAVAVARAPGRNYNPLFLYADVGLGKTHLCHGIANFALERHPQLKVMYTMTEDFIGGLIDGIQTNSITSFRHRHRLSDILIIDDIQFLSGKERAQEEFFHIFNALFEAGKQIVITSDRPPKEISHLENRLRSRFGAGIIVDIQSPDLETRIAILRKELAGQEGGDKVPDAVVLALAEGIPSNIRDLKGALNQLLARVQVGSAKIDLELAQQAIDRIGAGV
jgi:chromosomal replication initiator protein DnaA